MTTDPVRARWAAGETAFAAWLTLDSPAAATAVASAGFDAVVVDLQHGHATLDTLPHLLAAIQPTQAMPFIRAAWNSPRGPDARARPRRPRCDLPWSAPGPRPRRSWPPAATRPRGSGATAPSTPPSAEATNRRRPPTTPSSSRDDRDRRRLRQPRGDRRHAGSGRSVRRTGRPQPGIGLDTFADFADPALLKALGAVVVAATAHGLVPGIHAPSPSRATAMADRGFRFVSSAVDEDLLREAAEAALRATRPAE